MCLSKLLQASFCLDLYRQDFLCFPISRSRGEKALAWGAGRRLLRVGGADRSEKCRGKGGPGRGNSQHKSTEGAGTCLAWLERRREGRQGPSHPSKGLECQAKGLPQGARKAFALQGMAGPDEREPALARSEPPLGLAPSPGASPRSPALGPPAFCTFPLRRPRPRASYPFSPSSPPTPCRRPPSLCWPSRNAEQEPHYSAWLYLAEHARPSPLPSVDVGVAHFVSVGLSSHVRVQSELASVPRRCISRTAPVSCEDRGALQVVGWIKVLRSHLCLEFGLRSLWGLFHRFVVKL